MSIYLRDKFTSADCIRSITPFVWLTKDGECPRLEKSSMLRFSYSDITIERQLFTCNWTGNRKPSLHNPSYHPCIPWALVTQAGVALLQLWQKSPLRFLPSVVPTLSVSGLTTSALRHGEDEEHAEVITANGTCDARLPVTRERGSWVPRLVVCA